MTRPKGAVRRAKGQSIVHYHASQKALEAAELSFKTGMHASAAAKTLKVSRSSVTVARVVLEFGNDLDREDAYAGKVGLRTIADRIRKGLSPEVKEELRRRTGGTLSEGRIHHLKTDSNLWTKLGQALRSISELPHPKELIAVVNGNSTRKRFVRANLHNVAKWIEDFNNEWNRSGRPEENNSDS